MILFLLKGANLLTCISNLSTTVNGISSPLNQLFNQVSSLHKQVIFEQNTRNVEINLDPNSIRNHLRDSVRNWNTRKTELYFESESLLKILESIIIDSYSGGGLSHVLDASWSSWSFVKRSMTAAESQSLAFPVDCPGAEPTYQ